MTVSQERNTDHYIVEEEGKFERLNILFTYVVVGDAKEMILDMKLDTDLECLY